MYKTVGNWMNKKKEEEESTPLKIEILIAKYLRDL